MPCTPSSRRRARTHRLQIRSCELAHRRAAQASSASRRILRQPGIRRTPAKRRSRRNIRHAQYASHRNASHRVASHRIGSDRRSGARFQNVPPRRARLRGSSLHASARGGTRHSATGEGRDRKSVALSAHADSSERRPLGHTCLPCTGTSSGCARCRARRRSAACCAHKKGRSSARASPGRPSRRRCRS